MFFSDYGDDRVYGSLAAADAGFYLYDCGGDGRSYGSVLVWVGQQAGRRGGHRQRSRDCGAGVAGVSAAGFGFLYADAFCGSVVF